MEFTQSPWFFVIGGVLVVGLIGLLIFMRMKGKGGD
jgi:hypothetical protein